MGRYRKVAGKLVPCSLRVVVDNRCTPSNTHLVRGERRRDGIDTETFRDPFRHELGRASLNRRMSAFQTIILGHGLCNNTGPPFHGDGWAGTRFGIHPGSGERLGGREGRHRIERQRLGSLRQCTNGYTPQMRSVFHYDLAVVIVKQVAVVVHCCVVVREVTES